MYSLRRMRDNVGDSGDVSTIIYEDEDGIVKNERDAKPRVGVQIQVGTSKARTMEWQDFWQTTFITEILEEIENYVKFRTVNSTYEWRRWL